MTAFINALAHIVTTRPKAVVAVMTLLTVMFGYFATFTVQDNDFDSFASDGPIATTQDRIDELFNSGEDEGPSVSFAQLIVRAGDGDVVDADGVQLAIRARDAVLADSSIADALADPEVIGQPTVITWADPILAAAEQQGIPVDALDDDSIDQIFTSVLAESPEGQAAQIAGLLGGDVSDDRTTASNGLVVVLFDDSDGRSSIADAATGFLELDSSAADGIEPVADGDEVFAFEAIALNDQSVVEFQAEISTLFGLAFLLIIGLLIAIYRKVIDVVASLLGLIFAIVWSAGLTALVGPDLLDIRGGQNQIAFIIPILLIGLGVDYAIHLTMRTREEQDRGAGVQEATRRSIAGVGTALVLATITTVVGFLTNFANPLPPLQDFGLFAAMGVLAAFIVMSTFTPALRLLVRQRAERKAEASASTTDVPVAADASPDTVGRTDAATSPPDLLGRTAAAFAPTAVRRPWAVIGVVLVLAGLGGYGFTQLSTEFSQTDFFPTDSRAFATFEELTEAYGSGLDETTEVLIEGDVATAEGFAAIAAFQEGLTDVDGVRAFDGRALADSVVSRLLQSGAPLPTDDASTAATLEAYRDADPSAGSVITDDGSAALITIQTSVGEATDPLADALGELADDTLGAQGLDASLASENLFFGEILDSLTSSQSTGLIVTLVASALILSLVFQIQRRQGILGFITIMTVAVVALWAFGLMSVLGIPFNLLTAMTSALAIGIGVPFGIHVVNRFLEDRERMPDQLTAMRSTLGNTGGALLGSGVTTVAGFGVLIFASVSPMQDFGTVIAMTIALALISSLTFLPAMLTVWDRRERRGDDPAVGLAVGDAQEQGEAREHDDDADRVEDGHLRADAELGSGG